MSSKRKKRKKISLWILIVRKKIWTHISKWITSTRKLLQSVRSATSPMPLLCSLVLISSLLWKCSKNNTILNMPISDLRRSFATSKSHKLWSNFPIKELCPKLNMDYRSKIDYNRKLNNSSKLNFSIKSFIIWTKNSLQMWWATLWKWFVIF